MMKFGDGIDWSAEARRAAAESAAGAAPGELLLCVREALYTSITKPLVVDCGCNIGNFYPQFASAGFEYVGIDQSVEALAIAQVRWPGGAFVEAFLWDNWPARLGTFEVAVCNAVLQHNTHPEKELVLSRIAQALETGGLFAMQESTVLQQTRTQLEQTQWIALGERHGFSLIKQWHVNDLGIMDGYLFRKQ